MKNHITRAWALGSLILLSACMGDGSSVANLSGNGTPTTPTENGGGGGPTTPQEEQFFPGILVLSNRSDLISGGDALLEIKADDPADLQGVKVMAGTVDVSDRFALRSNGRYMGRVDNLPLGETRIVAKLKGGKNLLTTVVNHPNGGPVFSGPQVQPWTCTNEKAMNAQCDQPAEYSFKYLPANQLQHVLTKSDPAKQEFAPTFLPYDPQNPPADSEIATTTTETGVTLPFIVRVERGFQNRDRYQIMSLYNPKDGWEPWKPQPQWNRKLLIHHGGNVGVTYGPGNPPNGDISGTAPDGLEFVLGDSITVALGRGFVTLSTALANLGHNVNLVTAAESLMMAKERIVEQYGELRYTIGTGCSGGAIAQQHIANAYPGIYQGIIVQCSYPDVWTTATQFAEYNLLNTYFGHRYPGANPQEDSAQFPSYNRNFIPIVQYPAVYGHLPVNPVVSDLAFFPSAYPTQADCPGLRGAATQYDPVNNPGGLRCGLIDYMNTQFGSRPPERWSANEKKIGRGFTGLPLDNIGVQYGLGALKQGLITPDQFLDLNKNIGGFSVDVKRQPERTLGDVFAISNAYKTGAINTAENLSTIPIIDLRGPDPGIAHDAYHSWQMRARLKAKQGHFNNQVIWFGQIVLAGDSTYSTEALLVMDRWLSAIEADTSNKPLAEKVVADKPAAARDKCLSAQSLYAQDGPFVPLSGNLFYPRPLIPGTASNQVPAPPPEAGQIFDAVANQVCGVDFSAYDPTGQSGQLTGPLSNLQQLILQTRFGTPRTVAGDNIQTLTNKCQLKPVDAKDYTGVPAITDAAAFAAKVKAIFPQGVCDFTKEPVGVRRTETWLKYGTATEKVVAGTPLPMRPALSQQGWYSAAFR
ncbi:DUF6351 family protein [Limnobacter humi]|uniref:DUF6351 family protein n=1 Tax=Limnobacter humi TaxID=1778671 RepID=A0ABT1WGP4_9BURK|nr:DUF6351 family protein [Limnobacter humi]MCQ8896695.1 DUF6351 family protein [Limnobacter humi]